MKPASRPYSPYWLCLALVPLLCLGACFILAARAYRAAPRLARRLAAAALLLFYKPHYSVEPGLFRFCYPNHA